MAHLKKQRALISRGTVRDFWLKHERWRLFPALLYDPSRTRWILTKQNELRLTIVIPGVDQ